MTHSTYRYNPHRHVKIWLSKDPEVFMNTENQMRLIAMRLQNPQDDIHLIYDASLLTPHALSQLQTFCQEHGIRPIDADAFSQQTLSDKEKSLYGFYKDEITHLKAGGNLAVASDILRWLRPVYELGTYTDFDVPVDTSNLGDTVTVGAPLLLNIGSLQTRGREIVLSNNDFIAVVEPQKAQAEINTIQEGILAVLSVYDNDFVEKTEEDIGTDSFWGRLLIKLMKNRSESIYIAKSKTIIPRQDEFKSSRQLRDYISRVMTDRQEFIHFNKTSDNEMDEQVIRRLRDALSNELGFIKWFFFRNEYDEIKRVIEKNDDSILIDYLMKKERTLYLKSIVVCTTGPIAIAKALFNGYVFNTNHFKEHIEKYSFNFYGLQHSFISKNSIPIHESLLGMMSFLGTEDGKLSDSSWLENGAQLQKTRGELLIEQKNKFQSKMTAIFSRLKNEIAVHIQQIREDTQGALGFYRRSSRQRKVETLEAALACFNSEEGFDTEKFGRLLRSIKGKEHEVYAGFAFSHTKDLIERLESASHRALLFGLTNNRHVLFKKKEQSQNNQQESVAVSVFKRT